MYAKTKTGIAPEYARFTGANDMVVPGDAPFYILRPETVEAFYYLSKLTGDPIYRVSDAMARASVVFASRRFAQSLTRLINDQ